MFAKPIKNKILNVVQYTKTTSATTTTKIIYLFCHADGSYERLVLHVRVIAGVEHKLNTE